MTLIDEIKDKLSFLFERGFVISEAKTSQTIKCTVILIGDKISLRITHDRSDWFVDIGYYFLPENWYELWDILSLLKEKRLFYQGFKATNRLSGIRSILKSSIDDILLVENYKESLINLTPYQPK